MSSEDLENLIANESNESIKENAEELYDISHISSSSMESLIENSVEESFDFGRYSVENTEKLLNVNSEEKCTTTNAEPIIPQAPKELTSAMEDTKTMFQKALTILGRLLFVTMITFAFCYLLRTMVMLAYHLVVPIVSAVVVWDLYFYGGLTSAENFELRPLRGLRLSLPARAASSPAASTN